MADQSRLDFHRAQSMSRYVDDIIDAAENPEVSVVVAPGSVACEINARNLGPILLDVAVWISIYRPEHGRPWFLDYQVAAGPGRHWLALPVHNFRDDSGEWPGGRARLGRNRSRQRRYHDHTRLSLPPRVDNGAPVSPDDLAIPHPGLRVDRLAHCTQQPQAAHLVLARPLLAPLDKGPDRSRGSIKDVDLVPFDYLPEPVGLRPVWRALVHHAGRSVLERAIYDIAMAGH